MPAQGDNRIRIGQSGQNAGRSFNESRKVKELPFDIRVIGWKKKGLNAKDARRMARFQGSAAGQEADRSSSNLLPDPITRRQQPPQQQNISSPPTPTAPAGGGSESKNTIGVSDTQNASTGASVGATNPTSLPAPTTSPQEDFLRAKANGEITDEKIAQAHKFAASMGTKFDSETGYDRELWEKNNKKNTPLTAAEKKKAIEDGAARLEGYRNSPELSAQAQKAIGSDESRAERRELALKTAGITSSEPKGSKATPAANESPDGAKGSKGAGPALLSELPTTPKKTMKDEEPKNTHMGLRRRGLLQDQEQDQEQEDSSDSFQEGIAKLKKAPGIRQLVEWTRQSQKKQLSRKTRRLPHPKSKKNGKNSSQYGSRSNRN